ncbi:hypothetical protein XBJ2_150013 [Xenorhabdus bovienii str. Jollieti]|nr:hypothetical protein XBJ2_150013 [Xenorhabdus bovienii str. Jollieti]
MVMNNTQQQDRVKKNCIDIGNKVKRLRLARNISLNELSKSLSQ